MRLALDIISRHSFSLFSEDRRIYGVKNEADKDLSCSLSLMPLTTKVVLFAVVIGCSALKVCTS